MVTPKQNTLWFLRARRYNSVPYFPPHRQHHRCTYSTATRPCRAQPSSPQPHPSPADDAHPEDTSPARCKTEQNRHGHVPVVALCFPTFSHGRSARSRSSPHLADHQNGPKNARLCACSDTHQTAESGIPRQTVCKTRIVRPRRVRGCVQRSAVYPKCRDEEGPRAWFVCLV